MLHLNIENLNEPMIFNSFFLLFLRLVNHLIFYGSKKKNRNSLFILCEKIGYLVQ